MKLLIIFITLVVSLNWSVQVTAECCTESYETTHRCKGISTEHSGRDGYCASTICKDGTPKTGPYCGYQSCNVFGCNCGGGCRNNNLDTWLEAATLHYINYIQ